MLVKETSETGYSMNRNLLKGFDRSAVKEILRKSLGEAEGITFGNKET